MKKIAIAFPIIATAFINAHAESIASLNSTLSVMNLNHALTKTANVIPYVGKDISVSEIGNLHILSNETVIC